MGKNIIIYSLIYILFILIIYLFYRFSQIKDTTSPEVNQEMNLDNYYTKNDIDNNFLYWKNNIENNYYTKNNIENNFYNKTSVDRNIKNSISTIKTDENGNIYTVAGNQELGYDIEFDNTITFNHPIRFNEYVGFINQIDFTDNVRFNHNVHFNGNYDTGVHFNHHHRWINTLPPGSIIAWYKKYDTSGVFGADIPRGWAPCDGNWYKPDKDGFVNHASEGEEGAIKTPDLRGRFILGAGQGDGLINREVGDNPGGEENVTLYPHQMPSHKHQLDNFKFIEEGNLIDGAEHGPHNYAHRDYVWWGHWTKGLGIPQGYGFGIPLDKVGRLQDAVTWRGGVIPSHSNNFGGGQSHNNMPPYNVLTYIIKI